MPVDNTQVSCLVLGIQVELERSTGRLRVLVAGPGPRRPHPSRHSPDLAWFGAMGRLRRIPRLSEPMQLRCMPVHSKANPATPPQVRQRLFHGKVDLTFRIAELLRGSSCLKYSCPVLAALEPLLWALIFLGPVGCSAGAALVHGQIPRPPLASLCAHWPGRLVSAAATRNGAGR